jgi:phospholipase B1
LRKYNPNLKGYSVKSGSVFSRKAKFNVAFGGAIAQNMPWEAKRLVSKMKSDCNINVNTDWKLVTLWIGGNNLCAYCNNKDKHSVENYVNSIKEALDTLHAELPRTFVNLVQIIDVTRLAPLNGLICDIVHGLVCKCATDEETSKMSTIYQEALNDLISSGRYDTKDDFTVVLQPFFEGVQLPYKDGKPDKTYFAPDCFHFSTKGHMEAAKALWQNMFEPVGGKTSGWDLGGPLYCPSESNKYFYTKVNSPPPSLYGGAYDGTSDSDTSDHAGSAAVTATSIVMGSLVALMIIIIVIVAIIYKIRKRQRMLRSEIVPLIVMKS